MEEMVKAVNVYEKDGVVVEETIEVPVDELETLKEYMNGVDDDNQEEYNTEATGEMESLSEVEEIEGDEDEPECPGCDEPEEVEVIEEDEDTIELVGDFDGIVLDPNGLIVGVTLIDQEDEMLLEDFVDYDIDDEDDDEEDID